MISFISFLLNFIITSLKIKQINLIINQLIEKFYKKKRVNLCFLILSFSLSLHFWYLLWFSFSNCHCQFSFCIYLNFLNNFHPKNEKLSIFSNVFMQNFNKICCSLCRIYVINGWIWMASMFIFNLEKNLHFWINLIKNY